MTDAKEYVKQKFKDSREVEAIPDNYTPAYRKYRNILVWTNYKADGGGCAFHSCMFTHAELTQDEMANLHMMIKYMRPEELADINEQRARGCGCGKCSLPPLPMIAYEGNGEYKIVSSQKERVFTEARISNPGGGFNGIQTQQQQHRREPEPISQAIPEEINPLWEELGGER